jgi:hypothetical protein
MTDYRELESEAQVPDRCPLCLEIIMDDGTCKCNDDYGRDFHGEDCAND